MHTVMNAGNYSVTGSTSVRRSTDACSLSIVWLMLSRQLVLVSADQWSALSFDVGRSRVLTQWTIHRNTQIRNLSISKRYMNDATNILRDLIVPWSVTVCSIVNEASSPSNSVRETAWPLKRDRVRSSRRRKRTNVWFAACVEWLATADKCVRVGLPLHHQPPRRQQSIPHDVCCSVGQANCDFVMGLQYYSYN